MTNKEFEQLVENGIDALPERVLQYLKNVAIVIADEPTPEQLSEQEIEEGHTLFGLYQGTPMTERGVDYAELPDKITIFKNPILAAYTDPDEIRQCVENTIWHEVAHFMGFDDPWIRAEEEKRDKTL